nr:MAG TPA_asm: tail connector protein [Bacteriophage sp.]
MLEQIKKNLGANYKENTDGILQDIIDDITSIACDNSNRKKGDTKLFPYIKKAVRSEYLARGAEGLLSRNEGSISSSYKDIVEELRNNIIKSGLRRIR